MVTFPDFSVSIQLQIQQYNPFSPGEENIFSSQKQFVEFTLHCPSVIKV